MVAVGLLIPNPQWQSACSPRTLGGSLPAHPEPSWTCSTKVPRCQAVSGQYHTLLLNPPAGPVQAGCLTPLQHHGQQNIGPRGDSRSRVRQGGGEEARQEDCPGAHRRLALGAACKLRHRQLYDPRCEIQKQADRPYHCCSEGGDSDSEWVSATLSCTSPMSSLSRYFCLPTEAHDNDGLPHTLEHLVFMGSEDYPYKEVACLLSLSCLTSSPGSRPPGKPVPGFHARRLDGRGPHMLHGQTILFYSLSDIDFLRFPQLAPRDSFRSYPSTWTISYSRP